MQWQTDVDLTHRNSFGFPAVAERFVEIDQLEQLELVSMTTDILLLMSD